MDRNRRRFARSRALLTVVGAVAICSAGLIAPRDAKAAGDDGHDIPSATPLIKCTKSGSVGDDTRCLAGGLPPRFPDDPPFWTYEGTEWEFDWDPSVSGVTSISFTFYFNPALFTPVADTAGFLCGYTASGNCPVVAPGGGIEHVGATGDPAVPGPATGTQSITIGSDTVSVDATFSPAVSGDGLFFTMDFTTNLSPTSTLIEYSTGMIPGADYYVVSYSCTTVDMTNLCGSADYTESFKVIPEPSTWITIVIGFAGLGIAAIQRRNSSGESSIA
jgi:hypothetical protein